MSINPGKKEIESLKEAVAYVETMEKDLREMEAAYDELVEKCDRLERELKEAKVDKLDATALHRAVYSASCENITLHQKMEVLEKQLETVKKDRDEISSDYDDACGEISDLRETVKTLDQENDELRNASITRMFEMVADVIRDTPAIRIKDYILNLVWQFIEHIEGEENETDTDQDD